MNADLSFLAPLANHLWQSTVCVGIIWLLTIALKKNRAAVRYWLWFVGSAKFLVPFSAIIFLGSRLSWRNAAPAIQAQWPFVVDNAVQPFSAPAAPVTTVLPHTSFSLLPVLMAVWLCGVGVGVVIWLRWWTRMRRVRSGTTPLHLGLPIPVLSSASRMEPGVLGIFRPVLLLPKGIESHLTPAQLHAILSHEMVHVQRRDNLTAAIHIVIETIFWFFPAVWWLRARLIEERENACDEAVLGAGIEAESYVEGIIQVCKSYAESPAVCISGISGSDLKKRVNRIMNRRLGENLTRGKTALVAAICILALAGPFALGFANAPLVHAQAVPVVSGTFPFFEVASIKPDSDPGIGISDAEPGTYTAKRLSPEFLIETAYNVKPFQISGEPKWAQFQRFDIEAKSDDATGEKMKAMTRDERLAQTRLMLQPLLADRFKLVLHRTTTESSVLSLVVSKPGKLPVSDCTPDKNGPPPINQQPGKWPDMPCGTVLQDWGHIDAKHAPMSRLVDTISVFTGKKVVDNTGLTGFYDVSFDWTPAPGEAPPRPSTSPFPSPEPNHPSLQAALEEQFGLKLVSGTGPVDNIVIDHIEEPSPN